jgi:hypothetical protein
MSSPARDRYERERVVAQVRSDVTVGRDDVSTHFEGRAQPGDVLGIETGGERTHMGDTSEDEDSRRRSAERAVSGDDDDEPRRSER